MDYARAIADAALLALIATLGLLQLGHETTPELAQLGCRGRPAVGAGRGAVPAAAARAAALIALPVLAASGAPAMALVRRRRRHRGLLRARPTPRSARLARWVALRDRGWRLLLGAPDRHLGLARCRPAGPTADMLSIARQWLWFLWPAWPAVLWTLWRWRRHLAHRHVVGAAAAGGGGPGRQPGDARLRPRADARPAGQRGAGGLCAADPAAQRHGGDRLVLDVPVQRLRALPIWVIYVAMQTGVPAKPAANVAKLAPSFVPRLRRSTCCRPCWPRWPGCGCCAGAPGAIARRCGRAWCCRPAAWPCAGCC